MRPRLPACSLALALCLGVACGHEAASHDEASCQALAAQLQACGMPVPADLGDHCAASAEVLDQLAGRSCDALEGPDGKADGRGGWQQLGEHCVFNFECAGDLVCRPDIAPGTTLLDFVPAVGTCQPRAPYLEGHFADRLCDSSQDCVAGGRCVSAFETTIARCEAEAYGDACTGPTDELCTSVGLWCIESRCRQRCIDGSDCASGCDTSIWACDDL